MSAHSKIVGGSTASRVINCPGSVAMVAKMPPQVESKYAAEGTLLHNVIAAIIDGKTPERISEDLHDTKIMPALALLDQVDPDKDMELAVEVRVDFGEFITGVFGSVDVLGKIGKRAIILDW